MLFNITLLEMAADWCINLSAGWFGAAVIVPALSQKGQEIKIRILLENMLFAVAFFGFAYILKSV